MPSSPPSECWTGLRLGSRVYGWRRRWHLDSDSRAGQFPSQVQRKAALKLDPTGDLEGELTVTFTGLEGLRRRVEERNEDDVARRMYLEQEVQQYIPAASEVKLSNNPDWENSAGALVAEFGLKIPGWVSRGGRLALCPVGLFGATEKHLFDHSERTYPIYFEFPAQRVDDVLMSFQPGGRSAICRSPRIRTTELWPTASGQKIKRQAFT